MKQLDHATAGVLHMAPHWMLDNETRQDCSAMEPADEPCSKRNVKPFF